MKLFGVLKRRINDVQPANTLWANIIDNLYTEKALVMHRLITAYPLRGR